MTVSAKPEHARQIIDDSSEPYVLDAQIGFLLRLANQHHLDIFNDELSSLTPTQFSLMARLYEVGELSQNHLGRMVAMDAATTKGVIGRLGVKGYLRSAPSATDARRLLISLTPLGRDTTAAAIEKARTVTARTLAKLNSREQKQIIALLGKMHS